MTNQENPTENKENLINRKAVALGLPKTPTVPFFPSAPYDRSLSSRTGDASKEMSVNDYFSAKLNESKPKGIEDIPLSSFYIGDRYTETRPGTDYEEMAAQQQSALKQSANGVLKGANLAATTVAGGFGMLYGMVKAPFSGRLADVWDNEATRRLDDWNTKVDQDYLPNYYTKSETGAEWYSRDNWFKANFIFDKLVKNAGFAVGAMWSGNIAASGISSIGKGLGAAAMAGATAAESANAFKTFAPLLKNMARAFSQGKNVEVAAILEKELTSIADVDASTSAIAEASKLTNKFADIQDGARRNIMALYSSAGEASFEALSTAREYKANLIEKYKELNGRDPQGEDLEKIDASTESLGAVSFFGNMALLSITEHAQLPKLIGSRYSVDKQVANSLLGKVEEVVKRDGKYVKATPLTKFGKVWDKTANVYNFTKRYIFDPKEAAQEAGQFALQVGASNYYNKAYQSKDANALVDGFLYGLFGTDESGEGKGVFNSKEGAESILLGGITGSLMQIKGNIKEARAVKSNTEKFLTYMDNSPSFKAAFATRLAAANRGIVLQEQQQDAVMQGDKLEAKDLDADMMHNYIMPRIKYGRFDMVMDDIADLKKEGSTEKGLAQLKDAGLANINDTVQSYQKRLTSFEQIAKNTNEIFKASNLRFGGEVIKDEKGNPILDAEGKQQKKYSPQVIDKLVYSASKIADYDLRIPQVNMPLIEAGITTSQEIIDDIYKNFKVNEVAKEEALKQIDELKDKGVTSTVIDDLKTALSEVIELAGRKKTFLEEYNAIKETPLNYQPLGGYEFGDAEETDVLVKQNISAKKRKEKLVDVPLEVGKVYSLAEPVRRDGNKLHLAPKIAVVSQTLGNEIEVMLPDGTKTFISREDFKKYNIIGESNTDEDLQKEFDASIDAVLNNPKNSDLKDKIEKEVKEKLKEGEGKDREAVYRRAVINSLDDKKLVDAIEKEFNKRTKTILEKREKERLLNEALQKGKDALDKLQDNLGLDDVGTGEDDRDAQDHLKSETNASRLKSVGKLFHSGTTESEGSTENPKDPASSPEHINRSRRFLSKIKTIRKNLKKGEFIKAILISGAQQEKFGLNGLAQLSFNQPLDTPLDKLEDVNNVDKGIILQVFVLEREGKFYFIDENGDPLTEVEEQADVNKIVFQTMPTTSPFFSAQFDKDGKPSIRYRKDEEALIDQAIADWKAMRALLIASPDASAPYEFNVSRGLAIRSTEKNHISKVLIDDNAIATNQTLIVINTTGEVVHQGDTIKFPKGRPVLQNGDTLEYINNSKFTEEQAKTLYAVIQKLTEDVLTTLAKTGNLSINKKYANYLQNVLYWKKGKTDGGNQIRIEGNKLYIGKNGYPLVGIENYKDEIIANFQEAYHNINRTTLQPDTFNEEFDEFYLDKDDKLQTRTWKKYQVYLLSDKYPDGSPRKIESTPLFTTIVPGPVSFIQKYATIIDAEYPKGVLEKKKPKEEAPPPPPSQSSTASTVFGDFNFDGKTVNTINILDDVPIPFTLDIQKLLNKEEGGSPEIQLSEDGIGAVLDAIFEKDKKQNSSETALVKILNEEFKNELKKVIAAYIETNKKTNGTPAGNPAAPTPVSIEDAIEKERKKELEQKVPYVLTKGYFEGDNNTIATLTFRSRIDKTYAYTQRNVNISENDLRNDSRLSKITKEQYDAAIEAPALEKEINAAYDAKYIDAVNKGTITKEQALQALKKAGRESSDAYKQLSAPEAPAGSTDAKVDIEQFNTAKEGSLRRIKNSNDPQTIFSEINRLQEALKKSKSFVLTPEEETFIDGKLKELKDKGYTFKTKKGEILREGENVRIDDNQTLLKVSDVTEAEKTLIEKELNRRKTLKQELLKNGYSEQEAIIEAGLSTNENIDIVSKDIEVAVLKNGVQEKSGKVAVRFISVKDAEIAAGSTDAKADVEKRIQEIFRIIDTLGKEPSEFKEDLIISVKGLNLEEALNDVNWAGYTKTGDERDIEFIKNRIAKEIANNEESNRTTKFSKGWGSRKIARLKEIQIAINDAELAALETSPIVKETEVPEQETPPTVSKDDEFGDGDLPDYRRAVKGEKGKFITDEDIARLKEWHAKNLPQIPFQVLMNLVEINSTEKAWGVYEDGIAKFFKKALKGTEYHELFHGVWSGLLTSEERQELINEFTSRTGTFTDRASGKTVMYAEATDKQIEEKIADDFADFRNGKVSAKSLGGKVINFFKRIFDFFKSFVTKPSAKTSLFESIEKGGLRERKYVINNIAPKYSKIAGLSEKQTNNYVKDITGRVANMLKGENDKELLFNLKKLSATELFDGIRDEYIKYKFLDPNNFTGKNEATGNRVLTQAQWDGLVTRSTEYIQSLIKVKFNEEEQEMSAINSENSNKNDYAKDPFSIDAKSSSPFAVKLVVNTLPETDGKNQTGNLIQRPKLTRDPNTKTTNLVNASRAFVTLLTTLSDTASINSFFDKVITLAKNNGDYVRYIETLKVNLQDSSFNLSSYTYNDWRYLIQTYKVFNKQHPDVLVEYVTDGETYIGSANLNSAVTKIKKQWFENIKNPSKDNPPAFVKKQGKKYIVDRDAIKNAITTTTKDKAKFLNNLGIDITEEDIKKLDDETSTVKRVSDTRRFLEAISSIKAYLGESVELYSIKGEVLGVNGPLNTLAEMYVKMKNPLMDSTYINVDGKMTGAYAEHNYLSVFANTFNSVSTLDELLKLRPELNDEYSKNSLILKVGGEYFNENRERIKDLRVIVTAGKVDKKKGTSTSKLGLSNKTVTQININLEGNYYALVGADSTTEWGMSFGNHVSFSSFEQENGWEKTFKIFRNYLVDEINLALDAGNRAKLEAMVGKEKDLRFFKEILSPEMLVEANKVINKEVDDKTGKLITSESFLEKHGEQVDGDVKAWIDSMSNVTKKSLIESGKIVETSKINKLGESYIEYSFDSLQGDFIKSNKLNKSKLSESELTNLLSFLNVNYSINNTEYHKIIFGDPYQYKIKDKNGKITLDETKRIKLFESPRGTTFDVPELNTLLNDEYNTVTTADGEKILIADDDYGYHLHKNHLSTITVKDVMTMGSMANALASFGVKKIDKTNETDGASWLRDSAYREIKTKNGQWSPEAEAWHQWQMSYTRNKLAEKGKYDYKKNTALKKHDAEVIKKDAPHHVIEVLKPIVSGAKPDRKYIDIVIDKFSQLPVYYSMVEGKAMEDFYIKMFEDKIDYAVVESGRKAGIETSYDLYVDGKINNEKFDKKINVPFSIYGIQVETSHDGKSRQTEGSQLPKVATVDIYDKGVPTSEAANLAYEKFTEAKQLLLQNGYDELLKKLGIEEDAENEFFIRDKSVLSNSLLQEMLRRESSENAKDTLKLDENNQFRIPFEASPSYSDIRNIIFAMIGKSLTSQKVNGGPHVQVPVTMFEEATKGRSLARKIDGVWTKISKKEYNDLSVDGKKEVMLTDDTLAFYRKDEYGTVHPCEVLLPSWFQDKFDKTKFKTDKDGTREEKILRYLNTDEGKKILTGVGFRIPTQSPSSSEVFRVKGFLPDYMGHTVVVPTEITTKAGSDFDIDKLNMYLKSVYVDANGNVKLVEYKDGEEATKEFYGKVFDETRQKEIDKIERFDEFRNKLLEIVTKIETSSDEEAGVMSMLTEEEFEFYQKHIGILSQIEDQSAEKDIDGSDYIISQIKKLEKRKEKLTSQMLSDLLRNDFINDMYRRSLENKYFEALEDIITLPENFEKLLSPVNDGGLEDIADELDRLMDVKDNSVKARLLDRNWMTFLRHAFVTAKRWVGIAAVNITNHSLVQKASIYVNPAKFPKDDPYLKNDEILLKHNTVEIDGKKYISLSGIKDSDDRYISEKLSGYTTSIVDVAKNPFILKIINNELIISTFMFLERIGVSMNDTAFFLNQPIIKEYLKLLENSSKKSVFDKNSIKIINNKFSTNDEDLKNASIDVNLASLKNNISEYYAKDNKKNSKRNAEQQLILKEFLKYAKMAEYSFKFSQATNYDTTSFRSYDHYYRKEQATEKASKENIFSSVDDVLESGFLGLQKKLLGKAMSRTSAIFKLEKDDFRKIVNSVLKEYAENEYLSDDKYQTVADKLRASLIDYIAQTKGKYNQDIKSLLVELETSVSKQLQDAKSKYPTNELLQILTPSSSDRIGGANTITVKIALKEAYDQNLLTGMLRELRDDAETNSLYKDIVKLAILQGTYSSPLSIKKVIPIEDYSKVIAPLIDTLTSDDITNFTNGTFQRDNWKDDDIVPSIEPKMFVKKGSEQQADQYGNMTFEFSSPAFPEENPLSQNKQIMILNDRYNSREIGKSFLKMRRIQQVEGSYVDMVTNQVILPNEFKERKDKGDLSLNNVIGYEQVKDKITKKPIVYETISPKDGEIITNYVYKMINLHGDGMFASEHYEDNRKSVINNGTEKTDELTDDEAIAAFVDALSKDEVPENDTPKQVISSTENKTNSKFNFTYKGGFENTGKGTPQGDGKDKAMRKVANSAIVELADNKESSSKTSLGEVGLPKEGDKVIMLARNGSLSGKALRAETKEQIRQANLDGAEFIVGDMPNVDSQFIDYLQEIGAKFTIYHTGTTPRINVSQPSVSGAPKGEREYTPEKLTKANMPANGVFVFGSNTEGRHGLGAAKDAKDMFGAVQGQAEGLQGKSYAIVTKNLTSGVEMFGRKITKTGERSVERFEIREQLEDLMQFAENNPDKKFYITKLGSSLAGYSVEEIKNLFETIKDTIPSNIILPKEYEVRQPKILSTELSQPSVSGGVDSSTKINIYAGTGENAELSNFAFRPFEDKGEWDGLTFNTVEGAYQAAKMQYTNATSLFNESELTKKGEDLLDRLQEASGAEAKKLGRTIDGLNVKQWDKDSSKIMKDLLLESFKQNSEALQKLLATGNATLTHTQDKGKWGTEFPRLLMEVREELEPKQPSTNIESRPVEVTVKKDEKSNFKLRINLDGTVDYVSTGNKANEKDTNKALAKQAASDGFLTRFKFNNSEYAAAIFNAHDKTIAEFKIISLSESNLGGEVFKQESSQFKNIINSNDNVAELFQKFCQ